jgi:hypothetical protein
MRTCVPALLSLLIAWTPACPTTPATPGDEGEGEDGGEGEGEGEGAAETACGVFVARCVSCHDGALASPDLRPGTQAALLGAPSGYPGRTLVVAGDPDASFLYRKMAGTQGSDGGAPMPPVNPASAAELAVVRGWIAAGAADDCDGSEAPPAPLAPGGDVSGHIGEPSLVSGFGERLPDGVTGTCSTRQYWQYGNLESERMHPGRACLQCHRAEGEGPQAGFLGTVQQAVDDSDDCRGVGDTLVEILDAQSGVVLRSATTNSAGNFVIEDATHCSGATCSPFRVRLTLDGRVREMTTTATSGDCLSCHTAAGAQGAPGRIVAP